MKISDDLLRESAPRAKNMSDLCRIIGIQRSGGNYKSIHARIERLGLDISHFDSSSYEIAPGGGRRLKDEEVLVENSDYSTARLHDRLVTSGIKDGNCEMEGCPSPEPKWRGRDIRFHTDHINGNSRDNRIENLRILCPNCHSQTDTFCRGGKRYKRSKKEVLCSCGSQMSRGSSRCAGCYEPPAKIDWPSKEVLLDSIEQRGYTGTARWLSTDETTVTDNAVRKRLQK